MIQTQLALSNFFFPLSLLLLLLSSCGSGTSSSAPRLTEAEKAGYLAKGKEVAAASFDAMSSRLMQAMAEGGVAHAVSYCNTAAMPLVDSLSAAYGAQIRRTSRKIRNPADSPTQAEQLALNHYDALAAGKSDLKPSVVQLEDGKVAFYAPIIVKPACLACHGQLGTTLQESTYATIQSLYPKDAAIGYAVGDLRGVWSITFDSKK